MTPMVTEDPARRPRVAVVIPCYNAASWIDRTLETVFAAAPDLAPGEMAVIAVDDGSTDSTADLVRAWEGRVAAWGNRLVLETGPNAGACRARNRGLAIAEAIRAPLILFFDADDYIEGPMIGAAVALAEASGAEMVMSDMHVESPEGREIRHHYEGEVAPEAFFEGWMAGRYINPSGILWRTDFVRRIGGWDEKLWRAQDLDIVLRALFERPRILMNGTGAAIHTRENPSSVSRSQSARALDSRLRALTRFLDRIDGTPFEASRHHFHRELYITARAAFQNGETGIGRRAVEVLRRDGYRRQHGTLVHRLGAAVLGLERKVRLWGA